MKSSLYGALAAGVLIIFLTVSPACVRAVVLPPVLQITGPAQTVFAIGDVTTTISMQYFKLVDKQGQANVRGEGHVNYFMDATAPTKPGQPAVTEPGTWSADATTSFTWHNVGSGSHTFSAELVNNDNTPLSPAVVATASILVVPETSLPQLAILSPRDGALAPAGDITLAFEIDNFNLAPPSGQANLALQGHLRCFLDIVPPVAPGQASGTAVANYVDVADNTFTWTNIPPGPHTFAVELVNNDGTPLSPPVVTSITITAVVMYI